jgi:hypothetical protein|tara:strand:- start:210 stop:623 length:414 start_codon:yes stop_codon:yes gene_type:complete
MSNSVNILEVLKKAHQSQASMSKKAKKQIIDTYGRALTLKKVIDDFVKVNRNLVLDMSVSENANLLHGKDYTIHVSQKLSAKIDTKLVKEKLGELEYHKCKVPTQYKQIQAHAINEGQIKKDKKHTVDEVADFRLAM